MTTWEIKTVELKQLKESDKNPRKMSQAQGKQLETSIKKFGLCEPVVINRDFTIIGGHQRVRTLHKMKEKTVAVYLPSEMLTDGEVDELSIRLNRNHGEWDYDVLANEWDLPQLLTWGFDPKDLGDVEGFDPAPKDKPEKKKTTCPCCGHEW